MKLRRPFWLDITLGNWRSITEGYEEDANARNSTTHEDDTTTHDGNNTTTHADDNTLSTRQRGGEGRGKVQNSTRSSATQPQLATRTRDVRPIAEDDGQPNTQKLDNKNDHAKTTKPDQQDKDKITKPQSRHCLNHDARGKHTLADKRRHDPRAHPGAKRAQRQRWDSVTINEAWRKQKEEQLNTNEGDTWASTGHSKACHKTTVLINKRWSKHIKEVHCSLSRLIGLTIEKKFSLQITSAHFPHTGNGDEHVQQVYSEVQKHTDRCRKTTHTC